MRTADRNLTRALLCCAVSLAVNATAAAQSNPQLEEALARRWAELITAERGALGAQATREERMAMYGRVVDTLMTDAALLKLAPADPALVQQQTRAEERALVQRLRESGLESKTAKSADSRSTNPITAGLTERSGMTELLALAFSGNNFVSADSSAITVNFSALALYGLADPEVYSELFRYQQHSVLRRIGGSATFGTKIPEKEITGISGFPDADKLLDVVSWDVKIRLLGDRDPRSPRWYPITLGTAGAQAQIAGLIISQDGIAPDDQPLVLQALNSRLGRVVRQITQQLTRSRQVSLKAAGAHVRDETGKNKFTGELLWDEGLSEHADFTANLLYSVTQDVSLGAGNAFSVKKLTLNAALTTQFWRDVLIEGRSVQWSSGASVDRFLDRNSVPIPVENKWKVFTTFEIPVSDAAKMPFSVIFTDDKGALAKQKYFTGHIGVSYDFAALGKIFAR